MSPTAANPPGDFACAQPAGGRSGGREHGRPHPRAAPAARGRRGAGFTLLEVLVALAVVAIALLAAMRAAGSVGDNATRYRHAVLAEQCAQNLLIEQRLRKVFPPVGQSTGRCTQAGVTFTLEQNVLPTPNPNFRRVQVTVFDPAGWSAWQVVTIAGNMP